MKTLLYLILNIIQGICIISSNQAAVKNKNNFFPNLPLGPYVPKLEAIYPFESTLNHKIAVNLYLSRIAFNRTHLMGNVTLKIPFDDTLSIDFNMASQGSIGGWKENAYFMKSPNICSVTLSLLGTNMWKSITKAFNLTNKKCPLAIGTYISSGMNIHDITDNNFPKTFFYGKYRITVKVLNNNNDFVGGCISIMNILRPWETDF